MFTVVVLVFVAVSVVVSMVFVSVLVSFMVLELVHMVFISVGVYVVGEHPDSINEDETETAACQDLATARLPASCQDSLVGSHDKIEVRRITPS